MIMVNKNGRYSIQAYKLPAARMLQDLMKAAGMLAEDVAVMTDRDPVSIFREAYEDALNNL